MQKKTEGICFAISAGICWGSMGVAAQVLMEDSGFTVGDLVAGRLLGAGALLLMFEHFFMRRSLLKYFSQPGVVKDILLYGVLVLLTQLTFFLAIQCSNAGTAAILAATIPVFTTIWNIYVKHRAPQIREMACTALAIAAVVLITTKGDFESVSLSLTGVLWGLASSVAGAASNIQPNAVLKKIPVTVVVGGMTVGGIVMSIFFPPWAIEANWTTQSALFYAYIVVVGTLVSFLLYVSSLKMISATSASLLSCFEPITAVVLSVVLLGAPLTPAEGVGGVLVFAAVWLLASRKKAQA
ncbi:DMT family transporter [uncultured Parasutterella sp.]|jgi:drug/metabolite transporter (DMT)-like permease|uniref:DMT family transporter n=1 Tax=uncultured Parasutterella sp. TaxID=1263098 RepID=UPI0025F1DEF9|nr:DMT family transporter [uncultured Parasutterella sp.]